MQQKNRLVNKVYRYLLSEETKEKAEKAILYVALLSFFVHLVVIYLVRFEVMTLSPTSQLLTNPISAVYTPFSFILIYEVYLLIYYLPKSFSIYISKQYEIITLIIIRKIFKDLSDLELSSNWFEIKGDLQFTYDIIASLLLFYLIFIFEKQVKIKYIDRQEIQPIIDRFIEKKKVIAIVLLPLFVGIGCYTLVEWAVELSNYDGVTPFEGINNLFFDQFFTILILVDVVLLLISFFYTNLFHKIIRNSGFVISTILIRMSFGTSGLTSTILIVAAVAFGLLIILIHNAYEKSILDNKL
ncbi:hypothetical protein [Aquimarina brevivitae]|uniref:Uncharacterized protein n=1 Tax=Aquimarina brevivitae TaxID=323412 RepID=A0A4Q7NTW7_9FLAO|nr:hypothetical protein [Aquimarina brevivitae]RZS90577.1 hypothetical protein EV197_3372 [Aquimarina brevivitae]